MGKEDVGDAPELVPKKRRQLEQAPDLWLAQWLARDSLTPSERRRVQEQKAERRSAVEAKNVGIIISREGVAPKQLDMLVTVVRDLKPTSLHHTRLPSKVHQALRMGVAHFLYERPIGNFQEIIKASDTVVVCPNGESGPIWEQVKYARHRRLPVRVIMPNGEEQQ